MNRRGFFKLLAAAPIAAPIISRIAESEESIVEALPTVPVTSGFIQMGPINYGPGTLTVSNVFNQLADFAGYQWQSGPDHSVTFLPR